VVLLDAGIQCGGLILDVVEKVGFDQRMGPYTGDSGPKMGEEVIVLCHLFLGTIH